MPSINNILSALVDFLNEAQSLGVIKEFNLVLPSEQQNKEASVKAEESFSSFLENIGYVSTDTNCSNTTVAEDEKKKPAVTKQPTDADPLQMQLETNESSAKTEATSVESPNWKLVQITVDSNEMKRRIDKFISRKKGEGAEWNVQEFCGRSYIDEQDPICENIDSCARVDAIFVQKRGFKSHIKVSKVRNTFGPWKKIKLEHENEADSAVSLDTINERLSHMEQHLRLKSVDTLRTSIFKRLKDLEDRILFLEGTSPEYFNNLPDSDSSTPKKKNTSVQDKAFSNFSAEDIRKKMQQLKAVLKCKVEINS